MLDLVSDGSSWEEIVDLAVRIEAAGATIINTGTRKKSHYIDTVPWYNFDVNLLIRYWLARGPGPHHRHMRASRSLYVGHQKTEGRGVHSSLHNEPHQHSGSGR